jgi:hypothetical protein
LNAFNDFNEFNGFKGLIVDRSSHTFYILFKYVYSYLSVEKRIRKWELDERKLGKSRLGTSLLEAMLQ